MPFPDLPPERIPGSPGHLNDHQLIDQALEYVEQSGYRDDPDFPPLPDVPVLGQSGHVTAHDRILAVLEYLKNHPVTYQAADFSNTPTGTYTDDNGVGWKYVWLTSSGSITFTREGLFELLVVAGGGGGGGAPEAGSFGGGGGAGGVVSFGTFQGARYPAPLFIPTGTYDVVVGGGGAGGAIGHTGGDGGNSHLGMAGRNIVAMGGGGGTTGASTAINQFGGSGGGGANHGGRNVPGQGYPGAGMTGGAAGGGGGVGGAASGATGGPGIDVHITGKAYPIARGGSSTTSFQTAIRGSGGDGYKGYNHAGHTGGGGIVIIRTRTN